jgi:peptidoglycan/xylan/chitin deacetylase (PgdA/CDA1 family)
MAVTLAAVLSTPVALPAPVALAAPVAPAAPVAQRYAYQAPNSGVAPGDRVVALTFDDGPDPTWTPQILSILEHQHVAATFFDIGAEVGAHPQLAKDASDAGFPVQNHTYTHPDLTGLSPGQVAAQIAQTQQVITSATGATPACVRPPYNAWNASVLSEIDGLGLTTMSYSVDPRDWSRPGVGAIVAAVVGAATPGAVVDLHDGGGDRSQTVAALPQIIAQLRSEGYRFVSICGQPQPTHFAADVYAFGAAPQRAGPPIVAGSPLVGLASTQSGDGSWVASADGGVFPQGAAISYGDLRGQPLNRPIVGIAATPDGRGYWLLGADGGIFSFGDARFHGSTGSLVLNQPIVGMAVDPMTGGYWLVAADGGIFAFDAPFFGSMGSTRLNRPVVALAATPDGHGYWLAAADGGIFSFGAARFHGSTGSLVLNQPVVGMAGDGARGGYWLVAADGGLFAFDAGFYGSRGGSGGPDRFLGMVAVNRGQGYYLVGQHPLR